MNGKGKSSVPNKLRVIDVLRFFWVQGYRYPAEAFLVKFGFRDPLKTGLASLVPWLNIVVVIIIIIIIIVYIYMYRKMYIKMKNLNYGCSNNAIFLKYSQ